MGKQLSKACYYAAHITNITRMVHVGDVHQPNALLFLAGSIDPYHPVPILLRHVPAEPREAQFCSFFGSETLVETWDFLGSTEPWPHASGSLNIYNKRKRNLAGPYRQNIISLSLSLSLSRENTHIYTCIII